MQAQEEGRGLAFLRRKSQFRDFEGNLTWFLTGAMHVQLDNTKQTLSARNDQV